MSAHRGFYMFLVSDIELHLMGNGEQLFPNGECNNQAFE